MSIKYTFFDQLHFFIFLKLNLDKNSGVFFLLYERLQIRFSGYLICVIPLILFVIFNKKKIHRNKIKFAHLSAKDVKIRSFGKV